MAQSIDFQGFVYKINPQNRKELLVKKDGSRKFKILRIFEMNLHYLLCSKNIIVISTEKGFFNTLNPFSDDWQ